MLAAMTAGSVHCKGGGEAASQHLFHDCIFLTATHHALEEDQLHTWLLLDPLLQCLSASDAAIRSIMNPDVASLLQPSDELLQTFFRHLRPQLVGSWVAMIEEGSRLIFLDTGAG